MRTNRATSHRITPRRLAALVVPAAALLHTRTAHAADPEAVRFEVDAPPGCIADSDVRAEIAALGATFRDANLDDRARTFRVEVTRGDEQINGRLIVRDLVFRETVRDVTARTCAEATQSLALFVATALDEAPPPLELSAAPMSAPPTFWPAPTTETDHSLRERASRIGSGGIAVNGFAGYGPDGGSLGFRGYGAARVAGTTRLGLAGAVTQDTRDRKTIDAHEKGKGIVGRVGALLGWGAPWSDSVVGFAIESGLSWGSQRGRQAPAVPSNQCNDVIDMFGRPPSPCYDDSRRTPQAWSFVSPYGAAQVVFQVPFKGVAVRPIASVGTFLSAQGFTLTADTGIVWQAW